MALIDIALPLVPFDFFKDAFHPFLRKNMTARGKERL
jgi:hypothetical protein